MNLLIFLSYILTIGLKKINSPTFYILEFFKIKNITNKFEIIKYLEDKKIFDERFDELISEKMIALNNNQIELTKQGKFFALFMRALSKFFGVEPPNEKAPNFVFILSPASILYFKLF